MKVLAKVHYQRFLKWLEHMFTYSSDEIDLFKDMYENSNLEPVLVGSDSLVSQYTSNEIFNTGQINIYPNPANDYVTIQSSDSKRTYEVLLFNTDGDQIGCYQESLNSFRLNLPDTSGIYFIIIKLENSSMIKKIIKV